jgi:hypothetical protein
MKQTNILTGILLLALAMLACNSTAVQTVEVTRVVPQTVVVTEAVQGAATPAAPVTVGGFTTGTPVDVSALPALEGVGGGGEPSPCFVDSTEPSISWGYGMYPHESLCLNNFPTAPDSPGFTLTLTDPTGRTFRESFTYDQDKIINSTGDNAGYVQGGSNSEADPATPGVNISVFMPLGCGNWTVSANTQDGAISVGPTILTMECRIPQISVLPDLDINPFTSSDGGTFVNGETFYVVGMTYSPNTAITVALYQEDPAAGTPKVGYMIGVPKYATSLMTDSSGNFQAPFLVGSATQRGAYYVVAAPVITTNIYLGYFGARFSIK